MRGFLLAGILLSAPCLFPCGASAQSETLSGWVGSHRLSMQTRPVATSTVFPVVPAQAEFIAITEVHPESVEPVPFHYLVTGPGIAPFERRYAALGFGPVTYFLRVSGQPAGPVTLTNLDPGKSVPHILEVRGVTGDELARIKRSDTFRLMGTVINPQLGIGERNRSSGLPNNSPQTRKGALRRRSPVKFTMPAKTPAKCANSLRPHGSVHD